MVAGFVSEICLCLYVRYNNVRERTPRLAIDPIPIQHSDTHRHGHKDTHAYSRMVILCGKQTEKGAIVYTNFEIVCLW